MRVIRGLSAVAHPPLRAVVTVGVFDGVHRAHQRLIRSTVGMARRLKGTSVVVTFDPDPQTVLDPGHAQPALMPLEARLARLCALGVDWVWVIPFTKRFARMRAEQFIREVLIRRLHACGLVVGETFAFGRGRRGGLKILQALGSAHGMQVVPVREIRVGGLPISSSRIRQLIASGQLANARRLLGDAPVLYGVVVPGAGRGRRLGFPTANLRMLSEVLPPRGVYAVLVRRLDGSGAWRGATPPPSGVREMRTAGRGPLAFGEPLGGGVMNLGVRPTFGPGPLVCEVHLLNFSGALRGHRVALLLLARLRNERCFPSPRSLIRQIRQDLRRTRRIFARRS